MKPTSVEPLWQLRVPNGGPRLTIATSSRGYVVVTPEGRTIGGFLVGSLCRDVVVALLALISAIRE